MSSIANLPILSFVSSPSLASSGERSVEREIDRNVLVTISPDREELFMSKKSIDEIRQILKLRTGPTERHWLYQTKRRATVDFRDATARTSTLIHRDENKPGDVSAVRRVLSTASLGRSLMPLSRIDNTIPWGREGSGVNVWGTIVVSTDKKLLSPRPLGPTHILVIHTEPLSISKSGKSALPRRGRGDATKPAFPNMDVAINDVLFVMGAPNVVTPDGRCSLPHRLHKELPRVLLRVPSLQTFPELIVYLHTMNQAELFRRLIPEWMRDHIHPLPVSSPPAKNKDTASIFSPKKSRGPASLLGLLAPSKLASSASSTYSVDTVSSGMSEHSNDVPPALERTADTVARDIVDSLPFFSDEDPQDDELVSTIATLHALKANLEFLGYLGKSVWDELEMSINILTRALVHRAAVVS
ncbi:hypothetical protein C8R45DRAFT_840552 [Mycena sanguinolenta]|nr:hypothetical protein C8R45DRAFT_840552 [Mycena sanguinolenta]